MYALVSPEKIHLPAGSVVRLLASWQDYQQLCAQRGDSSIPRLKYRCGEVLLMSPLPAHGREASLLADIIRDLRQCDRGSCWVCCDKQTHHHSHRSFGSNSTVRHERMQVKDSC